MNAADRDALRGELRSLLTLLVKAGFVADAASHPDWNRAAAASSARLRAAGAADVTAEFGPHLDGLWALAVQDAQADPIVAVEETVQPRLQRTSLFSLEDLLSPDFDFDRLAGIVTRSASTG